MKQRKKGLREELKNQIEERKAKVKEDEDTKVRKEKNEKQKAVQIKKMYTETKDKAKEIKEKYREEAQQFKESAPVKMLYQQYDKSLYLLFDNFSKYDGVVKDGGTITMTYNSYIKMGQKLALYP